ncbi:phosphoribosylanthranilate isomerase [Hufsiella ginkgonis]|uniref:N-(5'-phosphoribosyl)anthranilate isomerase n=1 Tax=Hufsiella ginkgonis TaxID=2695274 RepID=A0A7K1XZS2_9SPHI|nr:phosphoribosylanthranilate isomerase [Hufsiella ginkgonis]MXV16514.1 phosphoribosylanthranilate isomerase [Hufsiella ginkgonis]
MYPRVKICCISSVNEAAIAVKYGASALGLVGKMPSGPGVISDTLIREIAAGAPPAVATFLLTSETGAGGIIAHHDLTRTNTLQLVDYPDEQVYRELRAQLPAIKLVQVVHVLDEKDIELAQRAATYVDALLLDSGNPNLEIKILGGTGNVHNWKISRMIRESVKLPVFLAGGLNAGNVRRAMDEVGPYGLDLCSSVRTGGKLDEKKLGEFFNEIYRA